MRRPASGWSATNRRKYAVRAGSECVLREPLPSSSGLSFSLHADHQTSIDRRDEPLETHTRGRRGGRESRHRSRAAGSEGAQERALGSRLLHGPRGSSSSTSRARMASSSTRHWIASAPWPGAGSVSGASHSVTSCSRPSRRMPAAAASTAPSNSPAATFLIRVSTFPRIERISRSPRSARTWAARRRLLVPTTAPARRSRNEHLPSRATRQSRTSSRRVTAPTTTPAASSVGKSLSE